jgi:hypothetical protein
MGMGGMLDYRTYDVKNWPQGSWFDRRHRELRHELSTLAEALRAGRLSLPASEVALQRYCTAATARAVAT